MTGIRIPFNKPHLTYKEMGYISHAHAMGTLSGDGLYTKNCHQWIERELGAKKCLLTHSCTAALEMAAILADVEPGDEVIMPSYTFVSTANAFVLRGAKPVFVDIREDTLNLDETLIEAACTPRTKAICPVHYAGVGCEMDSIMALAKAKGLTVVEDAAQGFLSRYKGKFLGTIGHFGTFSFHQTKNVISGEGGALTINDPANVSRAEIIREKGTNRSQFFRGEVDKYTWVDLGSSYLPGEIIAAFLFAQLEQARSINDRRLQIWEHYHAAFSGSETQGKVRRPIVPSHCEQNGHMYYVLLEDLDTRQRLITHLKSQGILSVFHYVPLHSAPAGKKFARAQGDLRVTDSIADRLLRLPLYFDQSDAEVEQVIKGVHDFFE